MRGESNRRERACVCFCVCCDAVSRLMEPGKLPFAIDSDTQFAMISREFVLSGE